MPKYNDFDLDVQTTNFDIIIKPLPTTTATIPTGQESCSTPSGGCSRYTDC